MSQFGVDTPVADPVGICQGVARNGRTNSHVIELVLLSSQTGFDIPQALAIGQLGEGHTEVLAEAGKLLDLEVAIVAIDTLMKNVERQMLHYLGENELAGVHSSALRTLLCEDGWSAG